MASCGNRVGASAFACLLVLCALVPATRADCPDADIRCRIPVSDVTDMITSTGCEVGGGAGASVTEGVITGTVSINGKCFQTVQTSDSATFIPVGTITIGQCFDLFQGGCQPEHCGGNSPGKRCNEQISDCTVYPPSTTSCSNTYTVQEGDSCWAIANSNSMTLEALQGMNQGVDCDNLQPFQQLCLAQSTQQGPGKSVCEGFKVSGRRLAARKLQQLV